MKKVKCLSCDADIDIIGTPEIGDVLVCTECDAEFEIVSAHPLRIDWYFLEDDSDDDLYDDSEDEEFDDEEEKW